jgi:hypothetical protein
MSLSHIIETLISKDIFRPLDDTHYECKCGATVERYAVRKHLVTTKHQTSVEEKIDDIPFETIQMVIDKNIDDHIISINGTKYDCICGSKNVSRAYLKKHLQSAKHQRIFIKRTCHICANDHEDFWTCDKCSNQICTGCKTRVDETPHPRCPFCRDSWRTPENPLNSPFTFRDIAGNWRDDRVPEADFIPSPGWERVPLQEHNPNITRDEWGGVHIGLPRPIPRRIRIPPNQLELFDTPFSDLVQDPRDRDFLGLHSFTRPFLREWARHSHPDDIRIEIDNLATSLRLLQQYLDN